MGQLVEPLRAFGDVFANPALRRVQLAWAGASISAWSYGIALVVYAFQHDGAYGVGLIGLVRWLLAAAASPVSGLLADRYPRAAVMIGANLTRAAAMAGMALGAAASAPSGVVYILAVVVAIASTAFRPAQSSLLPSLARTPQELAAANVSSSTIESVGIFAGPALGGLLLAVTSVGTVFFATAALYVASAAVLVQLVRRREEREARARAGVVAEMQAGVRTIARDPRLRLLLGMQVSQNFVDGALGVLIAVLALDLLDLGGGTVGFMNSALGIGGLAGAVAALVLATRGRLAADFGLGIVLWGLPIVAIGVWPNAAAALLLLGVVGLGNTIVDVSLDTLLQRSVALDVLGRVFAVFRSLMFATTALGAITTSFLVSAFGGRVALVCVGALLPVLALLSWRRLAEIDAEARVPARGIELLRAIQIFAPLPLPTLTRLAAQLERETARPGETIVRQGEAGERFYVLAGGRVEVDVGGRPAPPIEAGGFFGEIALLRDEPRTATVTAATEVELFALARDDFLAAVAGDPASTAAAAAVVRARLEAPRAGIALA